MNATHIDARTPSSATRRTACALLAALAVTLGGLAAPLAGTAHAGGALGGVINTPSQAITNAAVLSDPGDAGNARVDSRNTPDAGDFRVTGARPGAGVSGGSN